MKTSSNRSLSLLGIRIVFLLIPIFLMGYFLLRAFSAHYVLLQDAALVQSSYFLLGMIAAAVLQHFRFRLWLLFVLTIVVVWTLYRAIHQLTIGEFDSIYYAFTLITFSVLFFGGWLIAWALLRWRISAVVIAIGALLGAILVISRISVSNTGELVTSFLPALLFAIYLIYAHEQIWQMQWSAPKVWKRLIPALLGLVLLFGILGAGMFYFFQKDIDTALQQLKNKGASAENSMLKKDPKGGVSLKDKTSLGASNGRSNELLFAAYIQNYFEDTDIPNPLYLTSFYYSRFDTLTETFEQDPQIPYSDLFTPDLSKMRLYQTYVDSSVIRNSLSNQYRKIIDVELYAKKLSRQEFLAPHAGFSVQPIAVDKNFRKEFTHAYRAKSYISELNSAYFVYNATDPFILQFQEERWKELRKVKNFEDLPLNFYNYYTQFPAASRFEGIRQLALKLAGDSNMAPIDRILAIRDFFMSTNEVGEPLFTYSDNPGIPDIPSASKLNYFLFENRKGYCAYYAGATLFLLRALGIPSRIAVGFMTVDRSDKNKGWYWYYADQAHAWVQVFFPGFGWIDFDTTVGNREAEESPKPDGTPPLPPPKAYVVAYGTISEWDSLKKTIQLELHDLIVRDERILLKTPVRFVLDAQRAQLFRDTLNIEWADLTHDEMATALSFDERTAPVIFKKLSLEDILKKLNQPFAIDELYVQAAEPESTPTNESASPSGSPAGLIWIRSIFIGSILLLIISLCTPTILYYYFKMRYYRSKTAKSAYGWGLRALTFALHMLGISRKSNETAIQYSTRIDRQFQAGTMNFVQQAVYIKYAPEDVAMKQHLAIEHLYNEVASHFKKHKRLWKWINPFQAIRFFYQNNKM